jgi:hypothetical protein
MKITFLKDYQFYLGNDMSKMSKSIKGDSIEVDAETAERWIKKEVAKMAVEKVEVKPIEPITSLFEEEVVEVPAPKKRGRKKRI